MKRVFCLVTLVLMSLGAFAQNSDSFIEGSNLGIIVDLGTNTYHDAFGDLRLASAIAAGVTSRVPMQFLDGLYLRGDVKLGLRTCGDSYTGRMSNAFLLFPVHIGYSYLLDNDMTVFADLGPQAAFRLFKTKFDYDIPPRDLIFLDPGYGLNVGIEFNEQFRVSVGFDRSMRSLCKGEHPKNGSIWLTLAYVIHQN